MSLCLIKKRKKIMDKEKLVTFKKEMQDVLTGNILPFWIENMVDRENGGF